jgi:hypothetical protein
VVVAEDTLPVVVPVVVFYQVQLRYLAVSHMSSPLGVAVLLAPMVLRTVNLDQIRYFQA